MENIHYLYQNEIGLAFKWKQGALIDCKKVNFVFNSIGLHLTEEEIITFDKHITVALARPLNCDDCCDDNTCKSMLLESTVSQVSFAMSYRELKLMEDLVKGTIFELGLNSILKASSIQK